MKKTLFKRAAAALLALLVILPVFGSVDVEGVSRSQINALERQKEELEDMIAAQKAQEK